MKKANPVLYTVPNDDTNTETRPKALKDALPWQRFWSEVRDCGPAGATRWRITKHRLGRIVYTNLADEERAGFPSDVEQGVFDVLQNPLPVQQGDNLVVIHIDEKELRVDSLFSLPLRRTASIPCSTGN